ncbi:unnamed protein product [Schistocephalus solidus]|uniref:Death domain-containing protein n=1 Tax=Schistocephalus solidus TaxID=70667 RepID=A0A183SXR5_SCHSO|nr:unnamed protein product [Schistocephalus solidus]
MFFEDRPTDYKPSGQANLDHSADRVLRFIQNVADTSHLILSNIHLPIFLDSFTFPSVNNLQQSQAAMSMPVTPVSQRKSADGHVVGFELPLSKTPKHSESGQVNGAFNSIEELASQPKMTDTNNGCGNKRTGLTPSTPGRLSTSTAAQSSKNPASIVAANASRIAQMRANAHGIAEIFLATDEMAEQNAIILKNLVASTAFTSRLLRLNFAEFSVRQLVNWVFMTHHWPFHLSWLIVLVESSGRAAGSELGAGDEDEEDAEEQDGGETQLHKKKVTHTGDRHTRPQAPEQSQCFLKLLTRTMEEIASMPSVATILTCDDRDPSMLLEFVQTKMVCDYKRSELKRLIQLSLFLNPLIRTCIRDLRQRSTTQSAGDASQNPQPDADTLDMKRPSETSQFAFQIHSYLQNTANETKARAARDTEEAVQTTQDSSGETRSPLPVSIDSETTERGICFSNPANTINYPTCPVHLKKALPPTLLSKMNVADVCELLAAIADLPVSSCAMYQSRLRQQNITGLVLSVCDLEKLRTEMQMNFGDWQLFRTLVLYLRQLEGANLLSSVANVSGRLTRHGGNTSSQLETSAHLPDMTVVYPYAHMTGPNCQKPLPRQFGEQSQAQKNVFDVPVFVQHCTAASTAPNVRARGRLNAVSAPCTTDRTISDFSFGSGTEEMEFIWRRDFKPETLKPQVEMDKKPGSLRTPLHTHLTPQPEADETADSSTVAVSRKTPVGFRPKYDRASFHQLPHFFPPSANCRLINTTSFDSAKKSSGSCSRKGNLKQPSRTPSGQAVPVWLDPSGKPILGFSRSTIDLRSSDSCRHIHGARRHKKSGRKRMRREASSASLSAQQARIFKSASQGTEQMKMISLQPAYLSNPSAGETQPSFIPVWYPNLSCMSEMKPSDAVIANASPSSSPSSVASEDGTYDFPSEYSNHGQYYICPNHNTPPQPVHLDEALRTPDKRARSASIFECPGLTEYPKRPSKATSHHRHHHHQHPALLQATCSYSPQEFFPKRARSRQPQTPGPANRKRDERSIASQRSGPGSRAHTPSIGHQAQESYSPEECTCDYFLYMRGAEEEAGREREETAKNVNSVPTPWSYTHKISSPDLSEIEAMTSS